MNVCKTLPPVAFYRLQTFEGSQLSGPSCTFWRLRRCADRTGFGILKTFEPIVKWQVKLDPSDPVALTSAKHSCALAGRKRIDLLWQKLYPCVCILSSDACTAVVYPCVEKATFNFCMEHWQACTWGWAAGCLGRRHLEQETAPPPDGVSQPALQLGAEHEQSDGWWRIQCETSCSPPNDPQICQQTRKRQGFLFLSLVKNQQMVANVPRGHAVFACAVALLWAEA